MALSLSNALGRGETVPRALADFFSYFTVTTNVLVALTLTVPMVWPQHRVGAWFRDLRVTWSASAAILVVGIAYHVLLSKINHTQGWGTVTDIGLHYLVPPLYAVYWVLFTDVAGARWRDRALLLSAYPTAYFVYLMARGAVVGRYPYFFVDAGALGLFGAFRNALGILAFHLVVAWLLLRVARRLQRTPATVIAGSPVR